jgi:hypothetical protein
MGKASRTKRRRAAVRSAKRARNNTWWYGLTAMIVIAGISLIVYARMTEPKPVGPFVSDPNKTAQKDTHWHAALGVYNCDHWVGDGTGDGLWKWPSDPQGFFRHNSSVYAGLHSHRDGIIHMEPTVSEDSGRHATIGRYFDYGGWKLSATGYTFVDGKAIKNGDKCPDGKAGTLQWATSRWDGNPDTSKKLKFTARTGNPADYKLNQGDVIIIAFLPPGKSVTDLGNPPSYANLPKALGAEETPTTTPALPPRTGTTPASGGTVPTTGATPTSKP